jgi:hypothetical protein
MGKHADFMREADESPDSARLFYANKPRAAHRDDSPRAKARLANMAALEAARHNYRQAEESAWDMHVRSIPAY